MANEHTSLSGDSDGFRLSSTKTDAPILPIEQMRRLHQFAPEKLDWIFEHTQKEAEERREVTREVNSLIFQREKRGMWQAFMVAVIGIIGACFCAYLGSEIAACVIGGFSLTLITSAFIFGSKRGA